MWKKILGFLMNWWVITILAAVAAAVVLAFALPIFWDTVRPMGVRLLLVALVALVWGAAAGWRIYSRIKADRAIEKSLAAQADTAEASTAAARMRDALAKLKSVKGKNSSYLYDRPWYIIIGPPGAGKTTALLASGMQFPYAEQALAGFGGTRNLDFWFADDAVFIDTAGRYTTQDSDSEKDAAGWRGFLGELKKRRPMHPANGVLVAFPSDKLASISQTELDANASAVRLRLIELKNQLEFDLPVYVMFTKADTLRGFAEHFADLDAEGRRAVLGDTLPISPTPAQEGEFAAAFDRVAQAIADRTAKRLQDEPDQRRRAAILGYPSSFQGQRSRIVRFLNGIAPPDERLRGGVIRGVYFTSGVQGGSAVDMMAAGLGVAAQARPGQESAPKGRAYFLNRLLREVVLTEPGLAKPIDKAASRKRLVMLAGVGVVAALALIMIVGTVISYFGNSGLLAEAQTKAAAVKKKGADEGVSLASFRPLDISLQSALPYLDAMRKLPGGYADRKAGYPPLNLSFGLYQSQIGEDADAAYRQAAARIVLPRMFVRLREVLNDPAATGDQLYQPLKVYLTLAGLAPAPTKEAPAIRAWMVGDLATQGVSGATFNQIMGHVDAMLEHPDEMFDVWADGRAPYDKATVEAAREKVRTVKLADRAVSLMRQATDGKCPSWQATSVVLDTDAKAFANPEKVLALQAPCIFTKAGYKAEFDKQLDTITDQVRADSWVVGEGADARRDDELKSLRTDVRTRYVNVYSDIWSAVRDEAMNFANLSVDEAAKQVFQSRMPPLALLKEVGDNTMLADDAATVADALKAAMKARPGVGARASDRLGPEAGVDVRVTANFLELLDALKGDAESPAKKFFDAIGKLADAPPAAGGGPNPAAQEARAAAAKMGPQAAAAVDTAQKSQQQGASSQAFKDLATRYMNEVYPSCREATALYPFQPGAGQATAAQVTALFGPQGFGGLIASLGPALDKSGTWQWSDKSEGHEAFAIPPPTLQRADEIRKAFENRPNYAFSLVQYPPIGEHVFLQVTGQPEREITAGGVSVGWPSQADADLFIRTATGETIDLSRGLGDFGLFSLIENGSSRPAGPNAIDASFTGGGRVVKLRISYTGKNPFGRPGLWTFTCPVLQ